MSERLMRRILMGKPARSQLPSSAALSWDSQWRHLALSDWVLSIISSVEILKRRITSMDLVWEDLWLPYSLEWAAAFTQKAQTLVLI